MNNFEKYQTFFILLAIAIGLLLGQFAFFESHAESFILPFLLLLLYGIFLSIPLKGIKKALKNRSFLTTSIIINFIWTPFLAWVLGYLFLINHPAIWLGFILLLVTPCTDWYLIFTSTAKGNLALSTTLLPVNLLLQVILLPVYIYIFTHTMETVKMPFLLESVITVLIVPLVFAGLTRFVMLRKPQKWQTKMVSFMIANQLLFLCLAIIAMFASQSSYLMENGHAFFLILLPFLSFYIINFIIALLIGHFLKYRYEDTASLCMTILARNSPIALAIVLAVFPNQPSIALALIIGPLLELPILAIISQLLLHLKRTKIY
ncbi:arsenic resistance protein [Alkalihalobacillus trypoxylicola]|uniref:Arsenic resistance protein n=1 Tax=Alkalihalobacillus trypoxylicola TaxID=519424 RepID=A0A161PGN3_9BACI|nr:bile acid:sodium symporter [Alkalihalobacillus trypoxylicola]KYG31944.1 arsenic resistance protein [Alkalihalobacillus trypoxylicola]